MLRCSDIPLSAEQRLLSLIRTPPTVAIPSSPEDKGDKKDKVEAENEKVANKLIIF
jgi:hypothetical protein